MTIRERLDSGKTRVYGTEEALAQIFLELLNPSEDNIHTISDITPEEVFGLSVISSYATLFNSKILKSWMIDFLKLRISRLRIGRKELVLLGSGIREYLEGKQKGKLKFSELFAGL
ncbi:MAG: hypothetical protein ACE5KE_06165 [Methanosarcinales archaeon]